jgi:hypothetical protein
MMTELNIILAVVNILITLPLIQRQPQLAQIMLFARYVEVLLYMLQEDLLLRAIL